MNKILSKAVLTFVFSLAAASANAANYTFTTLGTLGGPEHETYSYGFSINNHGDIVGISNPYGTSSQRATLWSNGTITDLGALTSRQGSDWTQAWMINDSGQIAGYGDGDIGFRAFRYSNGTMTTLPTFGLYDDATAWAIDSEGNVYGEMRSFYDPIYSPDGRNYQGNVMWDINGNISTITSIPVSPSVNSYGASVGLKEVG